MVEVNLEYGRVYNFSAGPSTMPLKVLKRAQEELLNYGGSGQSVMEMSHRSREYQEIIDSAEALVREVMEVPDDYAVLFLQGGASLQFAMVPMNLYVEGKPVDVVHTGVWSQKAIDELNKLCPYRIVYSGEKDNFTKLPDVNEIEVNSNASYLHMVSNNTIKGTQFKKFPDTGDIPLVCDMSSDILSRKIDVKKFGLIFAGAQKNLGPAGVTLVVIRKDLADRAPEDLPTMLKYTTHIKKGSMHNTPPTFGIYILKLMMEWIKEEGGVESIEKRNVEKAKILYDYIDSSSLFYCPNEKESRSFMNVVFRIKGENSELEKKFVEEAKKEKLINLKGHRSVGGLRASIYNAMPLEGVKTLVEFMKEFESRYA